MACASPPSASPLPRWWSTPADHPSVRDIYERVRAFFPYVTIATVYSTLDVLEEAGIVRELPFQRLSRYDANLSPHANLVCVGCGMVVDADVGQDMVSELNDIISQGADFQVASQRGRLLRLVLRLHPNLHQLATPESDTPLAPQGPSFRRKNATPYSDTGSESIALVLGLRIESGTALLSISQGP